MRCLRSPYSPFSDIGVGRDFLQQTAFFEPVRQAAIGDDGSASRFRRVEHTETVTLAGRANVKAAG